METSEVPEVEKKEEEKKEGEQIVETTKKKCWGKKCCAHSISFAKSKAGKILGVVIVGVLLLGVGGRFYWEKAEQKNRDGIKSKIEAFVKENQPGTEFSVTGVSEEGGLYKISITAGAQKAEAYVSKDGKKLFPGAIDLDVVKKPSEVEASNAPAPVTEVTQKQEVPTVELFVMSYCPYGLQAEKGILPVVQKLGAKIKFDIKFVSYVMHGKKELDENMNQYCIQKEQPTKFLAYLGCFNKEGDSAKCVTGSKVDKTKLSSCVSATDQTFKLTETFNATTPDQSYPAFDIHKDLNMKYGVQGSPSLVINGQLVDASRDSASLLKAICSGFEKAPAECSATLSSASPSSGFGDGSAPASGASADASCQ